MDAGRLDRKIALRRVSYATVEGMTEPVETWATFATVWANVMPVSDGERLRSGETLAQMQSRFTIRYSSVVASLDPRDRLQYNGRDYDINGLKELGRREFFEITATARAETP